MAKVIITNHDPIVNYLYDEKESAEYFGDDYIVDYGIDVPDELLERYQKAYAEFWAVQDEIDKLTKKFNR